MMLIMLLAYSTGLMAQSYSGGSGTFVDPYQIANKTDLKYLSENSDEWGKYFKQTLDITFQASDFEGGGDFYNSGAGFIPIGSSPQFTGSYNGDGKSISNLYISRTASDNIGLFGYANGATIQGITLNNVDINGSGNVGAIAGYISSSSSVTSCSSSGTITSTGSYTGGLVGNCNTSTITLSNSSASVYGPEGVGGLVGLNENGSVSESYAGGDVEGPYRVGAFVGYNRYATVSNSYSLGDITRSNGSTSVAMGGFCGINWSSTIEKCYSIGRVFYTGATDPTDKGFVGQIVDTQTYSNNYFDSQASNQSTATGATAKTTDEMKRRI